MNGVARQRQHPSDVLGRVVQLDAGKAVARRPRVSEEDVRGTGAEEGGLAQLETDDIAGRGPAGPQGCVEDVEVGHVDFAGQVRAVLGVSHGEQVFLQAAPVVGHGEIQVFGPGTRTVVDAQHADRLLGA